MYKHFMLWVSSLEPHYEGVQRNIAMEIRLHRPPDYHPGVQINDDRKAYALQIALLALGYLASLAALWLIDRKLSRPSRRPSEAD